MFIATFLSSSCLYAPTEFPNYPQRTCVVLLTIQGNLNTPRVHAMSLESRLCCYERRGGGGSLNVLFWWRQDLTLKEPITLVTRLEKFQTDPFDYDDVWLVVSALTAAASKTQVGLLSISQHRANHCLRSFGLYTKSWWRLKLCHSTLWWVLRIPIPWDRISLSIIDRSSYEMSFVIWHKCSGGGGSLFYSGLFDFTI